MIDEDYFRLRYKANKGKTIITTQGFNTRKQLAKIIEDDEFFKIDSSDSIEKE